MSTPRRWNFERTSPGEYPLLLHFPYFDLYRKQVVKQADLVLAIRMCPGDFTDEQTLRDFDYYEAITVRDSSLSACTQAIVAAEVEHLDLAYDYLGETALVDLHDLAKNTRDGLHIASLAGTWLVLVEGFGGLRVRDGTVRFSPRLPSGLTHLMFGISLHGRKLRVEINDRHATYSLTQGQPIDLVHHGKPFTLGSQAPVTHEIHAIVQPPPPRQPVGRQPSRRKPRDEGRPT